MTSRHVIIKILIIFKNKQKKMKDINLIYLNPKSKVFDVFRLFNFIYKRLFNCFFDIFDSNIKNV